jgi:hypothetical protein
MALLLGNGFKGFWIAGVWTSGRRWRGWNRFNRSAHLLGRAFIGFGVWVPMDSCGPRKASRKDWFVVLGLELEMEWRIGDRISTVMGHRVGVGVMAGVGDETEWFGIGGGEERSGLDRTRGVCLTGAGVLVGSNKRWRGLVGFGVERIVVGFVVRVC